MTYTLKDVVTIIFIGLAFGEQVTVYAVKTTSDHDQAMEVTIMDDEKKQLLTNIFWQMNDISYRTETVIIETDEGNGNILEGEVQETRTKLYISVIHKTADKMSRNYSFNADQNEQLTELINADNSMWLAVLYGIYGSDDMICSDCFDADWQCRRRTVLAMVWLRLPC